MDKSSIENLPATLQQAIVYFADPDKAFEFIKQIRFPDGVVACPRCGSSRVSFISTRKLWTCKECRIKKQFTVRIGTILEDSPIGFDKWICAFWMLANAKNGISSHELGRAIGVTQRTAWFLLQRVRFALQQGSIMKMEGIIEVDEAVIGGLAKNKHKSKRIPRAKGRSAAGKTIVMGLLERTSSKPSRVSARVIKSTDRKTLHEEIRRKVEPGSEVHTDAWFAYRGLGPDYVHKAVDHAVEYVRNGVHCNGMENFWCLLKRTIRGTYVSVEHFHLFRYLDEQSWRFNERKDNDKGRFLKALSGITGKRLTWNLLVKDSV